MRLNSGGFLTIGYCFPYCFLEIFVRGQGLDGGGQSHDRGIPTRETTVAHNCHSKSKMLTAITN